MTNSAYTAGTDDPRACRGVIRALLYTLPLVVFVSLALVPMSANIGNSGICVHRCEAYAEATPTIYGEDFLNVLADEMGLSVNDTVATVAGVTATGTGLVIGDTTDITLGTVGKNALNNLAEAADYPDWDTLSQADQQAWVTKDNYDASKFNSLLDAFGLGNERDRFYSTGGANFEFEANAIDNIKRLGRIGSNWANNIGVAIEDIRETITNQNAIVAWFPEVSSTEVFNATGITGWPSYLSTSIYYSSDVNKIGCYYGNNNSSSFLVHSNSVVYGVIFWTESTTSNDTFWLHLFSKDNFSVRVVMNGSIQIISANATRDTYNGQTYYYYQTNSSAPDPTFTQSANDNPSGNFVYVNDYAKYILFSENQSSGGSDEQVVPDYPETTIPEQTIVYYPPGGIDTSTPWDKYVEPQRPKNEYNPNDQTSTKEWEQETKQNVMPLQNIKFDKLFPFCLMTDVKDLTEKIEDTITPGQQSNYLTIRIPMAYASNGNETSSEDIELDGTPVRDLLVMVRPFNQILLLFFMVFSLVMFWKSILTGD